MTELGLAAGTLEEDDQHFGCGAGRPGPEVVLGLAAAVLIDATLVRMLLVPSLMVLMGRGQLVATSLAGPHPARRAARGAGDAASGPAPPAPQAPAPRELVGTRDR